MSSSVFNVPKVPFVPKTNTKNQPKTYIKPPFGNGLLQKADVIAAKQICNWLFINKNTYKNKLKTLKKG